MAIIGESFVAIRPETTGFGEETQGLLTKAIGAIPMPAVFGALAAGAGVALLSIGESFEGAYKTIRSATGATAEQMVGLEDSFKNVLKSGPASMEQVADAISLVSQRTKFTGTDLEGFTEQMLKLGRITGVDTKTLVDSSTKALANFGIEGVGPSKLAMDTLLDVSQKTGISITNLESSVVGKAGATFRALGVDIGSAASILGTLEAAGVSTGPVVMGLQKVITGAAKDGKDAKTAMGELFDTLKNGADGSPAVQEAIKAVGQRGFLSLRDAVQSGKLTLDQFSGTMGDSAAGLTDRIAKENQTLGGLFKTLKNEVLVALEPIAMWFLEFSNVVIRGAVDKIREGFGIAQVAIEAFQSAFSGEGITSNGWVGRVEEFGVIARQVFDTVAKAWDDVVSGFEGGNTISVFADIGRYAREAFDIIVKVGQWMEDHWKPILAGVAVAFALFVAPVATVIAGLVLLYTRSSTFRDILAAVGERLKATGEFLKQHAYLMGELVDALKPLGAAVADFARFFMERWEAIRDSLQTILQSFEVMIAVALAPALLAWEYFHDQIMAVVQLAWAQVQNIINYAIRILGDAFDFITAILTGKWGDAWDAVKDMLGASVDFLKATLGNLLTFVIDFFSSLPGNIISALGDLAGLLIPKGMELIGGMISGITGAAGDLFSWFTGLPQQIIDAIPNAASSLVSLGGTIIGGMIDGMKWAAAGVADVVKEVVKDGVNGVIGLVNSGIDFLNQFQIHVHQVMPSIIPNIDVDWNGLGIPHIPTLHTGGVVPGKAGEEVLTRLLAGEVVINPALMSRTTAPGANNDLVAALNQTNQLLREQTEVIRSTPAVVVPVNNDPPQMPSATVRSLELLQTRTSR